MKNRMNFRNICLGGALLLGLSFTACSDDDYNPMPIQLTNVTTLDDMNTPITEAAMGDFIAIHGTGLDVRNIDSVLINDVALDMMAAPSGPISPNSSPRATSKVTLSSAVSVP